MIMGGRLYKHFQGVFFLLMLTSGGIHVQVGTVLVLIGIQQTVYCVHKVASHETSHSPTRPGTSSYDPRTRTPDRAGLYRTDVPDTNPTRPVGD